MSKKKLINCKSCNHEIAKSAKVCPNCGAKNKKPFFKRVWFWILVIFVLAGLAGGSDDETKENDKKSEIKIEDSSSVIEKETAEVVLENAKPVEEEELETESSSKMTMGQKNALR